jgi:chromate transporter
MTDGASSSNARPERGSLGEVAQLFLKLGCIAFGGPAAHVAMMRQEVVQRRHWITDQRFLDLFGGANLIPGPSSTELAIMLGYERAGPWALVLAGVLFIAPAMLIVLAFAWIYVRYGSLPAVGWVLYGIEPVVIAIIIQALYGLSRTAAKTALLIAIAVIVFVLYIAGLNIIALLFGFALLYMAIHNARRIAALVASPVLVTGALPVRALLHQLEGATGSVTLPLLTLEFLKLGFVVYGSGYVLLAFLRSEFVQHLHWLTDQQLVDAVAVGQFTPGPVFTTATFLGYLFAGLPGALLATVGIFLPSFILVALIFPLIGRLRASVWFGAFLDGANAAALGLMAAVTLQLARSALILPTGLTRVPPFGIDFAAVTLALIAGLILFRFKPNSAWLVLGGAVAGVAIKAAGY